MTADRGELEAIESVRIEREAGLVGAVASLRLTRGHAGVKAMFDLDQRVVGLLVVPAEALAAWSPPPYAKLDAFDERPFSVGSDPALPGTLTVPSGPGPFPAAILVHGSGPQDADETIGPNKPFKDLAYGLASLGVAVLRYVKRTRHAPAGVATVKEEVVDAARAAAEALAREPFIDPKRIVVVGHSQGGSLAPRIADGCPAIAAIAILAGTTRPLEEVLLDQLEHIGSLGGPEGEAAAKLIEDARAFGRRVRDPGLMPNDTVIMPPGIPLPGAYLLDQRDDRPAEAAAKLGKPIFVAHFGRDYQVTAPDLAGWRAALPESAIHEYPALDHLLRPGEGQSTPASYLLPGHADEGLIRDLAAWIADPR